MQLLWVVFIVVVAWCQNVKTADQSGRAICSQKQYVGDKGTEKVMYLQTKKHEYGLVNAKEYLAVKLLKGFEFLEVRLQFGGSNYYKKVYKNTLEIPDDNRWHELTIDLEPTDLPGLDKWHVYINVDGKNKVDLNTNYKWHYAGNHPKSFFIYAAGGSKWIPHANATVCNALEASSMYYRRGSSSTSSRSAWLMLLIPVILCLTIIV